ncbi:YSC84-related protein [Azotosporobacter soli]|uniref:lipid-binding SYLF domain-containing protein n=1 Tax=Azotosporobacter soli TaxID=3055040 RepID=UPI0031FF2275
MRSLIWKAALCLLLVLSLGVSSAAAATPDKERAELRQKTAATLDKLYEVQPSARQAVENAAGYAVFNNTGFKLLFFGSGHGRGMAVNNQSGREVFMKMTEVQAGLGLGIKEFALIFVFEDQGAWNKFVDSGWEFGGQATAAAKDGVGGDSLQGAVSVSSGVWMYQLTTKGLALELALKGTRYYKDSNLNN